MNDTGKVFRRILEDKPWDTDTRLVYADWLEENGWDAPAEAQRQLAKSRHWMREFAKKHHAYGEYHDWELEERTGKDKYGNELDEEEPNVNERAEEYLAEWLEFLKGHRDGGERQFGFDLPYDFNQYSEEMWEHFEVLTGLESPKGKYRKKAPAMHCAC